ncbi:DUF1275 domain-containing protein [Tuanshanicoccus lijuaniae]|uniref:YoaK family protein n=1 Tax=Aerococcaceae bacterium zg-1292 TaxID=2774330 RepID=UPI00193757E8|nr:DUF1275 domain-containing protein [Aerococcaceae bacterium zg-1292]MBF6626063.1 DUF1275 domain-containing protein [Aerococcaceae bacterium zg-BR9]MBF6978849.1 DUF1275 domain-containing protein [Aerococcaceae bacterium zg-BR22]QQA36772.1 DUF1275 domain-containing protein [Aerococcaceae bacterium zg-1292]
MMQKKLDFILKLWILLLTMSAGFLNAAVFLVHGVVVTHHTGTSTQMGIHFAKWTSDSLILMIGLLLAYIFGAMLSGYLFHSEKFGPKKRYGLILIYLSIGLFLVNWLNVPQHIFLWYTSFMMGTQNGMFVFYRGMVIRTTHMTGSLTDIGLSLGRWIRGKDKKHFFKFTFLFVNWAAFVVGCIAATFASKYFVSIIFYVAASISGFCGVYYFFLYHLLKRRNH